MKCIKVHKIKTCMNNDLREKVVSIGVKMASQLSGPNIEEEYLWSVTLDDKTKQFSWSPNDPSDEAKDDDDENFKPNHRLLIKTAILHPDSAKDEVTMLEIETSGYKKEKVKAPFLAMKSGVQLQQYVDILLPDTATIKITAGKGPITLVGSHCVDYYDYRYCVTAPKRPRRLNSNLVDK